jgi:carbonic anhydrase
MSDPINISRKEVDGKCDLKCAYNFKYTNSSATAINNGEYITVVTEKTSISPVLYNKQKYYPAVIQILYPSNLLYNDKVADAEIIIMHVPETGGKMLVVIIPIKVSSDSTSATTTITNVIKSVSVSAPSQGEQVVISNFNLENIVPKNPFFNFTGVADFIAFSDLNAIPISNSTFDTLKQMVKRNEHSFSKSAINTGLFYNSSGPNTTTTELGEGIYISCNPTGNSVETTEVTYKNDMEYDMANILEDPTFIVVVQTIIACVVFILIFYIWNYGYKFIDGDFSSGQITSVKG